MATRAEVEAAVAGVDEREGVTVVDRPSGRELAHRPPAEGAGHVLAFVGVDRLAEIEAGRWSVRPEQPDDPLSKRERAAVERRARLARELARERMDEQRRRAAEFEDDYARGRREDGARPATAPHGADAPTTEAPGQPGEEPAPTQAPESRGSRAYVI